jgi:hypothetical protein
MQEHSNVYALSRSPDVDPIFKSNVLLWVAIFLGEAAGNTLTDILFRYIVTQLPCDVTPNFANGNERDLWGALVSQCVLVPFALRERLKYSYNFADVRLTTDLVSELREFESDNTPLTEGGQSI